VGPCHLFGWGVVGKGNVGGKGRRWVPLGQKRGKIVMGKLDFHVYVALERNTLPGFSTVTGRKNQVVDGRLSSEKTTTDL